MKKSVKATAPVQAPVTAAPAVKQETHNYELYDLRKGQTHSILLGTDFKVVINEWFGWSKTRKGLLDYSRIYQTYYKRDLNSTVEDPKWLKVLVTTIGNKDSRLWIGKDLKRTEDAVTVVKATQI